MNMNEIKEARKKAKLTQKELSQKLGIPQKTIENWDRGVNSPPDWAKKLILEKMESMKGER